MSISIETLVSTMKCRNCVELYKKMNIQNNAIIINQTNYTSLEKALLNENNISIYSFPERGIGLSRNNALMRSTSEICMIADDDMEYYDSYTKKVENAYKKYPDADMILFNVRVFKNGNVKEAISEDHKINKFNSLRYGAVTFSFKREKILAENIFFSLLFGGGAKYGSGEDSIFLWSCLEKGLKIYAVSDTIADVKNDDSTWFNGFDKKYFYDKGALFRKLSRRCYRILILQFIVRKKVIVKESKIAKREIFKVMLKGAKDYGNN